MKNIMKEIIDKYGRDRVHYSVITYGERPSIQMRFADSFPTVSDLKKIITSLPKPSRGSELRRSLVEAKKLFIDDPSARPDAKKIVVVITDKESDNTEGDLKESSLTLEQSGIRIIAVTIGNEANPEELESIVTKPSDVIATQEEDKPQAVADKIMDIATKGRDRILRLVIKTTLIAV